MGQSWSRQVVTGTSHAELQMLADVCDSHTSRMHCRHGGILNTTRTATAPIIQQESDSLSTTIRPRAQKSTATSTIFPHRRSTTESVNQTGQNIPNPDWITPRQFEGWRSSTPCNLQGWAGSNATTNQEKVNTLTSKTQISQTYYRESQPCFTADDACIHRQHNRQVVIISTPDTRPKT